MRNIRILLSLVCLLTFALDAKACDLCKRTITCQECMRTCPICNPPKPSPKKGWWKRGWSTTIFSGPITSQTTSRIIRDPDFGKSGIVGIAGAKELTDFFKNRLGLEFEAQAVQHFGRQDHFEGVPAVLILRWKDFPWNKSVPTTFAIGDGISIASKTPKEEKDRRDKTSTTLNYVMAELTLSHPCYQQWAFILRYHHRSGFFGAFGGVHDASTAFAAGVKHWF